MDKTVITPFFQPIPPWKLKVGVSGSFSEVYQGYETLQQQASLEELALLLRHPSPNVHYYALLGLAEKDPKNKIHYYQELAGLPTAGR